MKNTFVFIFLLISIFVKGQSDSLLLEALRSKSKENLDKIALKYNEFSPEYFREIIDNYFEAEYSFTLSFHRTVSIKIIYKDPLVLSYKYSDEDLIDSVNLNLESVFETKVFYYENAPQIKLMKNKFISAFGKEFDYSGLFSPKLISDGYGIGGDPAEGEKELRELVAKENMHTLDDMLGSTTFEVQLYGVKGFRELQDKGYKLNSEEKRIIDLILNKKGKVYHVLGCSKPGYENVGEIIKLYELKR
jgi:hypothetical protein